MNTQLNLAKKSNQANWVKVDEGPIDQINRIQMEPGAQTRVKCHWDRKKHLFLVKGRLWVKLADTEILLDAGDSIDIEVGEPHQFANQTGSKVELIEIERMHLTNEEDLEHLENYYHDLAS